MTEVYTVDTKQHTFRTQKPESYLILLRPTSMSTTPGLSILLLTSPGTPIQKRSHLKKHNNTLLEDFQFKVEILQFFKVEAYITWQSKLCYNLSFTWGKEF